MNSSTSTIAAVYFDGRSSRKHPVQLDLSDEAITLHGLDAPTTYTLKQTRLAEPFGGAPCVLNFDDGARLEVDRAAYPQLKERLRYRRSAVEYWQQHWQGAVAAVVLMVVALGVMVKWGVPAASEAIVAGLPVSVDRQLGDSALIVVQDRLFFPSKLSRERIAEVQAVFNAVRPAQPRLPYSFKVMRMKGDMANAIALPNGAIIMSDAMVRRILDEGKASPAERRAQLAGVLAHEIGHVEGRHGMRSITRGSLIAAGSAALFGDFSAVAAGVPAMLMNMDYSRDMERAADEYAIARLHALGMSAAPLADLFESLDEDENQGDKDKKNASRGSGLTGSDYFSSHPATSERSKRFRAAGGPR